MQKQKWEADTGRGTLSKVAESTLGGPAEAFLPGTKEGVSSAVL